MEVLKKLFKKFNALQRPSIIKRSVEGNQAMKYYNVYKASQQYGKP